MDIKSFSKYPLLEESQKYINKKYEVEDLFKPEVIERSKERILFSITGNKVIDENNNIFEEVVLDDYEYEVEMLSYALSRILVSYIDSKLLINEYLKAESNTFYYFVKQDENSDNEICVEKLLKKMGVEINKIEKGFNKNIEFEKINSVDIDKIKENRKSNVFSLSIENSLLFFAEDKDLNLVNQEIEKGKIYLHNRSIIYDYFKVLCIYNMRKDLPYDTNNLEKKLNSINLENIRSELLDLKQEKGPSIEEIEEEKVIKALNFLDPDYSYERWRNIGFALADYYEDEERAKEVYKKWSKKGSKYDEKTDKYIKKIIEEAGKKDEKITIGSLLYYAKEEGFSLSKNKDN